MKKDETSFSEREEIEMLLPWYVGGTLDATGRTRVERYLARHPELRRQLDLVREEREETVLANEALPLPRAGALDRLMASLPASEPGLLGRLARTRAYQAAADFFTAPTARGVRYAAIAAAALLAVQAAAITSLLVDSGGTYRTAAGQDDAAGISFFVGFNEQASAAQISAFLGEIGARIVDGPKSGAVYKISIRSTDRSEAAEAALSARLTARKDLVRVVLPAKE